jgi:hypothetical protein
VLRLIYRGKLRLSFDIPFLDTPFYLYASHLYTISLILVVSAATFVRPYFPLVVKIPKLPLQKGRAHVAALTTGIDEMVYTSPLLYIPTCGSTHGSTCGSACGSTCGSACGSARGSARDFARASTRVSARVSLHLLMRLFTRLIGAR